MTPIPPISRRQFLRRSFAFSAAATLAGCGGDLSTPYGTDDPVYGGTLHFLMVGDWGVDNGADGYIPTQRSIATAMQTYAAKYNLTPDALFMLGDNFYGQMPGGATDPRWQTQFENMYPSSIFPNPALAVPGNHDYQYAPGSKVAEQLQYAAIHQGRWTMPSSYYTTPFPATGSLVEVIALDSNMPNEPAQPIPPAGSSYFTMSNADRLTQLAWLTQALEQPKTTPYRVVIGHHPLFSNGPHGDNQTLIQDWGPLFTANGVDLYLAGHDHDLQHLEIAGYPTSFVSSGAGGAPLDPLQHVAQRGPFGDEIHGFTHLQIRAETMIVRHIDIYGHLLHKFTRDPNGNVVIVV